MRYIWSACNTAHRCAGLRSHCFDSCVVGEWFPAVLQLRSTLSGHHLALCVSKHASAELQAAQVH